MRKRRKQRESNATFNLSFLDAISCGFGAIVILLVLTKVGQPKAVAEIKQDLQAQIAVLEQELATVRSQSVSHSQQLFNIRQRLAAQQQRLNGLKADLDEQQKQASDTRQTADVQQILGDRFEMARQKLSEEMKRMEQRRQVDIDDELVGGIPVDSEYIIFVIDTSGSMHAYGWTHVQKKMKEVLDIYPGVKGIQVMNDMGQYMFSGYAGKWIPDTPGRRKVIMEQLSSWTAFSNSSPVEGITRAIRTYGHSNKKVSIYVFGDEFTGSSIQEVVDTVASINRKDAEGNPLVRIHAIGFPVVFSSRHVVDNTGIRFSILMRVLCRKNGGTFVALNSLTD